MTGADISARNRANARQSTGPRTAEGKAVVATNARRHGATGRPDPESVALWLSVILDRPEITPADLLPGDEHGYRALALAEAEARRVAAERALREFENGTAPPGDDLRDLRMMAEEIRDILDENACTDAQARTGRALLEQIAEARMQDTCIGGRKHRLLYRYVGEARAQRRRAFEAWAEAGGPPAARTDMSNSRNKARYLA